MRLHPAVAASVAILGAALVILTFSELILFNEGPVLGVIGAKTPADLGAAVAVLLFYYALPGAGLVAMQPMLTTWHRVLLAGVFVGWIIEASLVNVVYESIPVSFAWPSISLHAYVDVLFGLFVLRIALRAHPGVALATTLALGIAWGLWGSWPWPETRITDAEFAKLAAVSAFLLTLGLWLSDRVPPSTGVHPWVGWAVLLISLGLGVLQLLPFLPYGLALVPLVALTGWALVRGRKGDGPLLDETPPPVWRYGLPSLSAVLAWVTYTTISAAEMGLPSNEVIPAILVLTVVGYLWVLVRALLGR